MAKSGLDIVGLPDLIQSISNDKKTGVLKVQSSLGEKDVYFHRGDIQQVSSPQKPSILAEGLRRHPDLDEESYFEICNQQKETGQSLASLLLSDEDGKDLIIAVCQFQILEEICELFVWEDCHYEFLEGEPQTGLFDMEILEIDMAMNTNMVLLEAARRYDEWQIILKNIPSKQDVIYLQTSSRSEEEEVKAIIALIDGFRDIEEVLASVRLSPFVAMKTISDLVGENTVAFKTASQLLQMAKLDVLRENREKSIKLYERVIELGESGSDVTTWLANSYETAGLKEKAASKYKDLGYIHLKFEEHEEASRAFAKVVELRPMDLEAQERLVTILARMGSDNYAEKATDYARWLALEDRRRAILLLKESIEKCPENLNGLEFLGVLYQEQGEKEEAVKAYQILAESRLKQDDLQGAIATYKKIIFLAPENLEERKSLAEVYRKEGKMNNAVEEYRIVGSRIVSRTDFKKNDKLVADLAFVSKRIREQDANDLKARQWLAQAHMAQSKNREAIEELEKLLEAGKERSDPAMMVDTLKNLVSLKPDNMENRFSLAENYLRVKKEREAIQEYFSLGLAAAEKGSFDQALKAFEKLLSYDPSNYASRLKKAEILIKKDKKEEAIEELMLTGYLSVGADKQWQAVKAFRQVLTLDRDSSVLCYLELGRVYEKLGKKKEAIAAYKKHIQKSVKRSNFGDALASCEHILEISPDNDWTKAAKQKLVEILPKLNDVFQRSVS